MTIFDYFKYPIPENPTKNDITSVPIEIYRIWINHPSYVKYKNTKLTKTWLIKKNIVLLRTLIKEYDIDNL